MPRLGLVCDTVVTPNVCEKPALLYVPARKFASEPNAYDPRLERGNVIVSSLYRKSTPARNACAPACCDRLSTISPMVFARLVGLLDNVPNDAIPEILTAGPIGS